MSIDYAKALKDYGWDNLINAIHSDPGWQKAYDQDKQADYTVNIPGIGPVSLDGNGRINALDMDSAKAYQQTGNAPVYNTIWDGRNQETGAFNGSDPATYQVSHGGVSPETLGMLAAIAITAGTASGALGGTGAAEGVGAGTAGDMSLADAMSTYAPDFASNTAWLTDALPDVSTLGVDAAGNLAYPGMEGYISPDSLSNATNYSNEGHNYPTSESTATSPINATTGPNAAPTVDLSGPSIGDALKKITTPENLAKLANVLKGGGTAGIFGSGSGFAGSPNEISNMTPGMMQVAAAQQQQQQAANPFQIKDDAQPQFAGGGYLAIPEGVRPQGGDSQIARLAKMLQEG